MCARAEYSIVEQSLGKWSPATYLQDDDVDLSPDEHIARDLNAHQADPSWNEAGNEVRIVAIRAYHHQGSKEFGQNSLVPTRRCFMHSVPESVGCA